MSEIVIAGIGQTPVGEHWEVSLRSLASRAVRAAIKDAGGLKPQAMYIGNLLAPVISHQSNLGALITESSGLSGIEAYTVEAAGASGGAAMRLGYLAVASGYVESALVLGVEKVNDMVGPAVEAAVADTVDYDYEAIQGLTPSGVAGLVMRRYMHEYHVPAGAFAGFSIIAHANAANNPNAMYRKAISREAYLSAAMLSDPLNLFDMGPYADGAAAVLLTRSDLLPSGLPHPAIRVTGSGVSVDTLSLHDRSGLLDFNAARYSVERACRHAGILPGDVDFFELCDSYTIYAALSLEAAGFATKGEGWKLAGDDSLTLKGKLPILTMGGCKGRGNPLGATGIYQVVEAVLQLRGQAGANQIPGARRALVQCLGGPASTAAAHVLEV